MDRRFKHNAAWATIGTASQVLFQAVAIVVLARLLSPYEFGIVSAAGLITQLALIFSEFGVGPYVVQRADLNRHFIGTSFRMSCGLGAVMAAVLWFGAPAFAVLLNITELEMAIRVYAAIFLMNSACAVHEALIHRDLDFKYLAQAEATSFAVGYACISILCAALGFSYWSLVIGHFSQSLIKCLFVNLRHRDVSSNPASLVEARLIACFGLGQTLSRFGSFISSQADSFIVTLKLGVASIGHYGRAHQLVTMPTAQLGQIFDKVIFPLMARMQHERLQAGAKYRTAIAGVCMISLPVSALLWIMGEQIVNVVLGPKWSEVIAPMQVLALAIPFRLIHKVSDPTARAMGETYSRAWRQWLVAATVIILAWIFVHQGLRAVAWAVVAAAALDAAMMIWLCCKVADLPYTSLFRSFLPGIKAGGIVALLALVVQKTIQTLFDNDVLILATVGTVTMGATFLLLRRYRLELTDAQL